MTDVRQTERCADEPHVDAANGGGGLHPGVTDCSRLLDALDDGVLVFDARTGRILEANRGACRLLGHERATLLAASFWTLAGTHEEGSPRAVQACAATAWARGQARFEARYRRADRELLWCEVRLRRADAMGPRSLVAMLRDIERAKAESEAARVTEQALRKSEERFVRIFQSSVDAILVTHASTGKIVEVNPAFTRVLGWERTEAIDRSTLELGMWPEPGEREAVLHELECEGDAPYLNLPVRRKDGVVREGIASLRPIELDGVPCHLFTFRDTTDHKHVELERERLIAELTARNAEMEQFTFTVSHDLKSPLVTITGFLGMLERDLAADNKEGVRSDIARIGSAANKMLGLLSDLLELSRVGRTNNAMENVPLSEVMRDALELLSGPISARNVAIEVADDLPEVYGDRVRLVQVAQNLLENAIKYMGDQTHPKIAIGARHDPRYHVCFVSDNGVGVDCRYVERIFGLFEKLNPRSEGSGVGLALVRRIVESHGGSIWVESGEQAGSTFVFRIPRRTPAIQSSLRPGGLQ